MMTWRYMTIDLAHLTTGVGTVDQLNGAGAEGWELVAVTQNGIAYLRRSDEADEQTVPAPASARTTRRQRRGDASGEV
jgi:hypothetical protein